MKINCANIEVEMYPSEVDIFTNCYDVTCNILDTMNEVNCTVLEDMYTDEVVTVDELLRMASILDSLPNLNCMHGERGN